MTAEKMTLAEALDVAHDVLGEQSGEVLGRDAYYSQELAQAAAVLREFRERGLPFYEAAESVAEAYVRIANTDEYGPKLMRMVVLYKNNHGLTVFPGEMRAMGRLTTEGE